MTEFHAILTLCNLNLWGGEAPNGCRLRTAHNSNFPKRKDDFIIASFSSYVKTNEEFGKGKSMPAVCGLSKTLLAFFSFKILADVPSISK